MLITNTLSASQLADIAGLEAACKQHEPLQGSLFLSNDLNFDPKLPCFYLLYRPGRKTELIAFLSIFAPSAMEAEIYALTAPAFRKQGCFNTLLEKALLTLRKYGISSVLFVHEPASLSCPAVLNSLYADYLCSEYLMTRPPSPTKKPSLPNPLSLLPVDKTDLPALIPLHALSFQSTTEASTQFLTDAFLLPCTYAKKLILKNDSQLIGFCFYTISDRSISLFAVAIHPSHRQKGYAAHMLQALFFELSKQYPRLPITLQVNSLNKAACSLYQKLGFQISSQIDYSFADREELLTLYEP